METANIIAKSRVKSIIPITIDYGDNMISSRPHRLIPLIIILLVCAGCVENRSDWSINRPAQRRFNGTGKEVMLQGF